MLRAFGIILVGRAVIIGDDEMGTEAEDEFFLRCGEVLRKKKFDANQKSQYTLQTETPIQ